MKYRLTFCEADTGILLNQDGSRSINGQSWMPTFSTESESIKLKDALLKEFPNGECWIKNLELGETKRYYDRDKVDPESVG